MRPEVPSRARRALPALRRSENEDGRRPSECSRKNKSVENNSYIRECWGESVFHCIRGPGLTILIFPNQRPLSPLYLSRAHITITMYSKSYTSFQYLLLFRRCDSRNIIVILFCNTVYKYYPFKTFSLCLYKNQ